MKPDTFLRRTRIVRFRTGAPATIESVDLAVRGSEFGLHLSCHGARSKCATLRRQAAAAWTTLLSLMPPTRQRGLALELGYVRTCILGHTRPLSRAWYLLAVCAGKVVALHRSPGRVWRRIWHGGVDLDAVPRNIPVVVGPSATLTLVTHILDAAESCASSGSGHIFRFLSVVETSASPYPPHHTPHEACHRAIPFRVIMDAEHWSHPVGTFPGAARWNLEITCSRAVSRSVPCLLIDSLTPRTSIAEGDSEWDAEYTYVERGGIALCGRDTLRLRLEVPGLLRGICGAVGRARVAIDQDPILGDRIGLAPALATDLVLSDILAGTTS